MRVLKALKTPVVLLIIVGLLVSVLGMIQPDSLLLKVFSFIPIYTPMSMLARMNTSTVPAWQVALSIALAVATVGLFGWLSAKIYRVGVLMYGNRPSLKEIARALRNEKNA